MDSRRKLSKPLRPASASSNDSDKRIKLLEPCKSIIPINDPVKLGKWIPSSEAEQQVLRLCMQKPCANCTKKGVPQTDLKRRSCQRCRAVNYCNETCQKEDWIRDPEDPLTSHITDCEYLARLGALPHCMLHLTGTLLVDTKDLYPCPFAFTKKGLVQLEQGGFQWYRYASHHLPYNETMPITLTWDQCPQRFTHSLITIPTAKEVVRLAREAGLQRIADYCCGTGLILALLDSVDEVERKLEAERTQTKPRPAFEIYAGDLSVKDDRFFSKIHKIDVHQHPFGEIQPLKTTPPRPSALVVIAWTDEPSDELSQALVLARKAREYECHILHVDERELGFATKPEAMEFMEENFDVKCTFPDIFIDSKSVVARSTAEEFVQAKERALKEGVPIEKIEVSITITARYLVPKAQ